MRAGLLSIAAFGALMTPQQAPAQTSTPPAASTAKFIAIGPNALLSSGLIGAPVRSQHGDLIGKIEDVVFDGGQLTGIILAVGESGAQRFIGLDPGSMSIKHSEGKWQATVNAKREEIQTAPEFRYEGKWKR